ncbi:PREDICTED: cytochrome P450 9e2-like [Nicrophorus vespilloides]|uniref:Cytochrome P450 9e2-like n=1 Tax=Nicrophorus vespilloides TaxID=110193 RepID=A0ABM1N6F7_NICVS|nr:PREDICTED: cytochrome P450 9e2-like [Nicrophorus vespilloides]
MRKNVTQGFPKPIVGDSLRTMFGMESFMDMVIRLYNRFPDESYTGVYMLSSPTLLLRDPDLIKQILIKDFDHFVNHKPFYPHDHDPLWNENLFALRDDKWREMRTVLSPAFTGHKMRLMFELVDDCASQFVEFFGRKIGKDGEVLVVELKDSFSRYANDVIATCAFGIKVDSLQETNNEFYQMGKKATDFNSFWKTVKVMACSNAPALGRLFRFKVFSKEVSEFFTNLIVRTIDIRLQHNIVRPDMLNLLIEARRNKKAAAAENGDEERMLSDLDITAQGMLFFFAGFETVSTLMCFMAYELALNPIIQDKLKKEVDVTAEECNGNLTYERLSAMKYMHMVVSETLRKWPSGIVTDRVCVKPYTIPSTRSNESAVHLKVGDHVWLPIAGLNYDEKYFPDPKVFSPERFSEENRHDIDPSTYCPFGLGPRNCIGSRFALMEVKTLFFHILHKFEFTVVNKTVIPIEISKTQFNLNASSGYWLGLKPRT